MLFTTRRTRILHVDTTIPHLLVAVDVLVLLQLSATRISCQIQASWVTAAIIEVASILYIPATMQRSRAPFRTPATATISQSGHPQNQTSISVLIGRADVSIPDLHTLHHRIRAIKAETPGLLTDATAARNDGKVSSVMRVSQQRCSRHHVSSKRDRSNGAA